MSTPLKKPVDTPLELSQIVSGNVRAEMARRRVTQKELSEALGLAQTQISKRLNGRSEWRVNDLPPIAEALGVSIDVLIYGGGYENTPAPLDAEVLSSPNWIRTSNPSVNGFKQVERSLPLAA